MSQPIRIALPGKLASEPQYANIDVSIVILGANGAGKTRFSVQIENGFLNEVHRITAQKSLKFPERIAGDVLEHARFLFRYGIYSGGFGKDAYPASKEKHRYGGNMATGSLDDFNALANLLFADLHQNQEDNNGSECLLHKLKNIWEEFFTDRKLVFNRESVDVVLSSGFTYNATNMSDGEKIVFYYIGTVLCVHKEALIVVDEPELHLHRSLVSMVWNRLEDQRPDCKFIYLTHDIDFAVSRQRSVKIWLRKFYEDNLFDYDLLGTSEGISEEIFLKIQGSRHPVIFIEGLHNSMDYKIYSKLFKNHVLLPVESCDNVVKYTKSFSRSSHFHRVRPHGIVDRDRRTDDEISKIGESIKVLNVAECEHIFLTEVVLNALVEYQRLNISTVQRVRERVFGHFKRDLEMQVFEHVKHYYEGYFRSAVVAKDLSQYKSRLNEFVLGINVDEQADLIRTKFQKYLSENDYVSILSVYNKKKLYKEQNILKELKCHSHLEFEEIVLNIFERRDEEFLVRLKCYLNINIP